nr:unnamed protein product [Callosobruchus analis]
MEEIFGKKSNVRLELLLDTSAIHTQITPQKMEKEVCKKVVIEQNSPYRHDGEPYKKCESGHVGYAQDVERIAENDG